LNLDINQEKFYIKYAFFYTLVILVILLLPFAVYINYSLKMQESKTEIQLKEKSIQLIKEIEKYDSSKNEYFKFPRFKSYSAGLYDINSNKIFSLINENLYTLKPGYKTIGDKRLYVIKFEQEIYFKSKYLAIITTFDKATILKDILIVFTSIMIVAYLLSLTILKSFAKPFNNINKSLDTFIKDSMHEINTPLSIISINIDMFVSKYGKDKYLSRIKSASKILSTIYNDMNYLIKEQTIQKAKKDEIDFSEFLHKSIDYFGDIAELKGIKIVEDISSDIHIMFVSTKLQKIIDNNLSNAIKYSNEESQVIITLKQENNKIILGFKDFGIGMHDPDMIFSRYYREDETKGGFGIGLNIVKKIIQDENIDVSIESKPEVGSYFEYTFYT